MPSRTIINGSEQVQGTPSGSGTVVGNTVTGGSSGAILFVDNSGTLSQSPLSFSWGVTNSRLGIGTNNPATPLQVKTTSSSPNQSFTVTSKSTLTTGVSLSATNDGNTAYMGLEVRGSPIVFTQGNVGFNVAAPTNLVDIASGVAIGNFAGVQTAPTNGLIVSGPVGISTSTVTAGTRLDVVGVMTANGLTLRSQTGIQFNDAGTHWVGFQAPTTVTANSIWFLPTADGSAGQLLKTDGSKNLSWVSGAGSASISGAVSGGQSGSVLFIDPSGNLNQENTLFNYSNTLHQLGVGTNSPTARITSLVGITGSMVGLLVTQAGTSNAAQIVATNTGNALAIYQQGNTTVNDFSGAITLDNTTNTGVGVNLYSNQASPATLGSLLRVHTANVNWTQPTVYVRSDSTSTAAPTVRLDGNPASLALVDLSQTTPAGKFQIVDSSDMVQIQGRRADDSTYDSVMTIQRLDTGGSGQGGNVGIDTGSSPGNSTLQVSGSFATATRSVSAPYSAAKSDQYIRVNASASPNGLTISLPTASGIAGRIYHIVKTDDTGNFVGIAPASGDTILRQSGYQLFSHEQAIGISSNGSTNWQPYGPMPYSLPYVGYVVDTGYTANVGVANTAWAIATPVMQPVTISAVRLKVTTSSGNIDVGVYDRNGRRISSAGSIPCPPVGKTSVTLGNVAVLTTSGTYYLVLAADNITAAFSTTGADMLLGTNSFASSFPLPAALTLPGASGSVMFAMAGIVAGGVTQ